jgi:uncharacterized membrane protein YciS (DUF1049 family)
MHYFVVFFIGFCLGVIAALKVAEVSLAKLRRDIKRLELQMNQPTQEGGKAEAASNGELAERFS